MLRTLSRELHRSAGDRQAWMQKDPEHAAQHLTAALTCGSFAQALERAADSLAERNDEISRAYARLRD